MALFESPDGSKSEHSPLPWGEGGPRPALSSAGAGRVRDYLHSEEVGRSDSTNEPLTQLATLATLSSREREDIRLPNRRS